MPTAFHLRIFGNREGGGYRYNALVLVFPQRMQYRRSGRREDARKAGNFQKVGRSKFKVTTDAAEPDQIIRKAQGSGFVGSKGCLL